MNKGEDILSIIEDIQKRWDATIDANEKAFYQNVLELAKQLDTKGGNITKSVSNLRTLQQIKSLLGEALNSQEYVTNITNLANSLSKIDTAIIAYFKSYGNTPEMTDFIKEIKRQTIGDVVNLLSGSGADQSLLEPVREILTADVTSGSKWADMVKKLDDVISGKGAMEGGMKKYTTQIVTDAINQYAAVVTETMTADLGLVWYQYVGANVDTTRPLCSALTKKRYVHKSELPSIAKGVVNGRQTALGKNGLPLGQIPGTNGTNFQQLRGGYRCNHLLLPVNESVVPEYLKEKFKDK